MTKLNMAPTKSNLLKVKEQLSISMDGYELLEQKREILVMELMHMVEQIKLLEREIDKLIASAYPALKSMLTSVGGDRVERIAHAVSYDFNITEKSVIKAGMTFSTIDMELPKRQLFVHGLLCRHRQGYVRLFRFFKTADANGVNQNHRMAACHGS